MALLIIVVGGTVALGACAGDAPDQRPPQVATVRDSAHLAGNDTAAREAGGEVADDSSATPKEQWITDANVLALVGMMNAHQISAANVELQAWHSDTVRDFATSMLHEHTDLQHSVDSAAGALHLVPIAPALALPMGAAMQAQVDSVGGRGPQLERAYVQEQVSSHALMAEYLQELAGVAEAPAVQTMLSNATIRVASELSRARALQALLAASDSTAVADSAAKDSVRRRRQGGGA